MDVLLGHADTITDCSQLTSAFEGFGFPDSTVLGFELGGLNAIKEDMLHNKEQPFFVLHGVNRFENAKELAFQNMHILQQIKAVHT